MMGQMGTEFKVGVFTLVAAGIIGYMFFVLSPDTFHRDDYHVYHTIVQDAAGIVSKTHVKTNGVIVGKVTTVKLEANQTRVAFEVAQDVKIPSSSRIAIKEKGLLGDVFMEIIRGEDNGSYIEPGGLILPSADQVSISKLVAVAGSVGSDIKQVTEALAKALGGKQGEENMTAIVTDIRELANNSRLLIEENRNGVRQIVDDLAKTTSTLRAVVGEREDDLRHIVTNVRAAADDLRQFSVGMREILGEGNREKIDKIIASFDSTMQDVEVTAKNVRLVADKIERGEGTLGKLIHEDETITEIQSAIKEVRQILGPATRMQLTVDYHGELRQDTTTQHYFNAYMRTRPDKFYLMGFTDASETVRETTFETIPVRDESPDSIADASNPRALRERVVEKKALRFNAQFGKRWGFAQVRFGLFESSGGLGGDFFLWGDRIRLSLEAFDWQRDSIVRRTAHLKTYASVLFFNHIYALIGIDDPSRLDPATGKVNPELNYFVGAGLSFNDADLKTIFGTASLAF